MPTGTEQQQERSGREVVTALAGSKAATPKEKQSATDWFLSAEADGEAETRTLELNIGTSDTPRFIEWTIRPVDVDTMRSIRRRASAAAQRKRGGDVDEYRVNLEIVAAGTADPDLPTVCQQLGIVDAAEALSIRFARKPGFIAQISAEIMGLSGFDDDDVREAEAAKN